MKFRPLAVALLVPFVAFAAYFTGLLTQPAGLLTQSGKAQTHSKRSVASGESTDFSDCAWHSHHPFLQQWSSFEGQQEADARAGVPYGGIQCPMCGEKNQTVVNWENLREAGLCPACGATNRFRQLAFAINQVAVQLLHQPFNSVRELAAVPTLRVLNTQCTGALHNIFKDHSGYVCSEYMGSEYKSGDVVEGVRHEDLQQTSFESDVFDLVISSEVFEHIPDPYLAHAELYRILKPHGAHVFTAPFAPALYEDIVKARLAPNGSIVFHGEPEYHGDPIRKEGIPVFVIFSQQMVDKLCDMGFRVRTLHLRIPEYGILGNGWVFQAVKP